MQIPIRYEEIYVNGKKFGEKGGLDSILSFIDKATKPTDKNNRNAQRDAQALDDRQLVPVVEEDTALQKIIPLYSEQVRISRRMVKYKDAVITKANVTENQKISIELAGEKIKIRYPDGTERTLESTVTAPAESTRSDLHTTAA